MIIPLAILADISCSNIRRHLLLNLDKLLANCFPQKDNPQRRVFHGAKLSTVIITGVKESQMSEESAGINVRVYPWNSFDDKPRGNTIRLKELNFIDPLNIPIPLVDAANWKLCIKVHSVIDVKRLGEVGDFSIHRGEINQTVFRNYITNKPKDRRLLKGVEVGRYHIREKLSQGFREWFDENKFYKQESKREIVNQKRIATQRITGVDEKLRIVAVLIEPVTYFADSTNSVSLNYPTSYRLENLLGIFNSSLYQWRFKITSTNNNVATNELKSMPFRTIDFNKSTDKDRHDRIVAMVDNMLAWHKQLAVAQNSQEQEVPRGYRDH